MDVAGVGGDVRGESMSNLFVPYKELKELRIIAFFFQRQYWKEYHSRTIDFLLGDYSYVKSSKFKWLRWHRKTVECLYSNLLALRM